MSNRFCQIDISDIDLKDQRYKISLTQKPITWLSHSIREVGLMYPPIVQPVDDKFIIVSGFNRVSAHIHNNRVQDKPSKILVCKTKTDESDYQCLLTSIATTAFKKQLTHAELILSVRRLVQFSSVKQIAEKSPAIFNTELSSKFIGDLLTIGAMPDPTLELIHIGNLSIKAAKKISCFEKETIKIFLTLFSKIKASNNKQQEIILHMMEITARDGINPERFFINQDIQNILFDDNKEPGVKTSLLRAWLFEHRFPTVFKTRQMTRERIATLKLDKNIQFKPPENFDSQNYAISFAARNYHEFKANTNHLMDALENEALKKVFDQ